MIFNRQKGNSTVDQMPEIQFCQMWVSTRYKNLQKTRDNKATCALYSGDDPDIYTGLPKPYKQN